MRPSSSEPPLHPARNNATPNRAPSSVTTTAVLSLDSRSIVSHDSRRETKGLGPMKKGAGRLLSKHRDYAHLPSGLGFVRRPDHHLAIAIPDHTSSTSPNGHAPCRKP